MKDGLANSVIHFIEEDKDGWLWCFSADDDYPVDFKITHVSLVHSVTGEVKSSLPNAPFELTELQRYFSAPDKTLFFVSEKGTWTYTPEKGFQPFELPDELGLLNVSKMGNYIAHDKSRGVVVELDESGKVLYESPFAQNGKQLWADGDEKGIWLRQFGSQLYYLSKKGKGSIEANMNYNNGPRKPWVFDAKRQWSWVADFDNLKAYDQTGQKVYELERDSDINVVADIFSFFVDENGLLWLGTRRGIYLLDIKPNRFKRYLYKNPNQVLWKNMTRCRGILEKNGFLYVNTYDGAKQMDLKTGNVRSLNRPAKYPEHTLQYIFHEGKDGRIWSFSNHISEMDGETGALKYTVKVPGDGYKIWSSLTDNEGKIWINKGEGLFYYKDGELNEFKAYNGFSALKKSQVYFYHQANDGLIWLGTNNGLFTMDLSEGITSRFWSEGKNGHYLPAQQIQYIHEDEDGYFWMATENEGLVKWHPKTKNLIEYNQASGLPTNTIYSVTEDEKGFLWMSSDFGLIQMHKNSGQLKTYLHEDGISDAEFNRTSFFKTNDGQLYFGGQNGVTSLYPKDFWESWEELNESPLEVYEFETGVGFSNSKGSPKPQLYADKENKFSHDTKRFELKLRCPDYFLADKTKYYYRLVNQRGLENEEWVQGSKNEIRLIGVHPGLYKMDVEARGLDGERIGSPLSYEINIPPPFSGTWTFRVLMVMLVLGLGWAILRWRTNYLKKRQVLLERLVKERTRQINEGQVIIKKQAEQIKQLDAMLSETDRKWVEELHGVVQSRLGDFNLNIGDIADEMNVSRTHFFRKLKNMTGLTPNQFLQDARLQEAKALLENKKYDTVKAVSFSVGFKNSSYFSRLYKEKFGHSPSSYFTEA